MDGIKGQRVEDLARLAPDVLAGILPRIYPQMLAVVREHQDAGRRCYIATAASQQMAEMLAARARHGRRDRDALGDRSTASTPGRLAGPFAYGEGKARALREFAAENGIDLAASWAYSDSASDLPMLEAVGHPVAVNPDAPAGGGRPAGGLGGPALREARPAPADRRRHADRGRGRRQRQLARLAAPARAPAARSGGSRRGCAARRLDTRLDSHGRRARRNPPRARVAEGGLRAPARARRALHDDLRRGGQAALHAGGPRRQRRRARHRLSRASIRSRAASTRRCTGAACGRCASSPASARPRRRTSASATCSTTARPASRRRSTCRR